MPIFLLFANYKSSCGEKNLVNILLFSINRYYICASSKRLPPSHEYKADQNFNAGVATTRQLLKYHLMTKQYLLIPKQNFYPIY